MDLQPDLPVELSDLVLALLAKDPKDRPSTVEVRAAVRRISRALPREGARPRSRSAATPVSGTAPPPAAEPAKPPEGGKTLRGIIGVSLVLGLATAVGTLALLNSGTIGAPPPPPEDLGKMTPIVPPPQAVAPAPAPAPAPSADAPPAAPEKAEPVPRGKPSGTLTLITTPESDVFGGGRKLGTTPLFNVRLTEGTHLLRLKGPDGQVHVFSVPIKSGKNTAHRLVLGELPVEGK